MRAVANSTDIFFQVLGLSLPLAVVLAGYVIASRKGRPGVCAKAFVAFVALVWGFGLAGILN